MSDIIVQIGTPESFASGVTDTVSPNNGGTLVTPNFIQGVEVTDPSAGDGYAASKGSLYLSTSGVAYIKTGTLDTDWDISQAASPGGSDTQIQFNNSDAFGGSSKLTWDGTALAVDGDATATGNIAADGDATVGGDAAVTGGVTAASFTVGVDAGIDANITTAGLVGKTIVVSKGLIVGFA